MFIASTGCPRHRLLNALLLSCDETRIHLPCFILMSELKRARFIGQLVRHPMSSTRQFGFNGIPISPHDQLMVVEYETDSEVSVPDEMRNQLSGSIESELIKWELISLEYVVTE